MKIKDFKMKDKRGITGNVLVGFIIAIIGAGILFLVFPNISDLFSTTVDKDVCHTSVLLRSEAIEKGKETVGGLIASQIPLRCKTKELIISSTDPEKIKNEIANAMYDCWWMLGEGKRNFFTKDLTGESYCVICSKIKFADSVKSKLNQVTGLNEYLGTKTIPGRNVTYWQYLTSSNKLDVKKTGEDTIETSRDYSITYSLIEGSTLLNWAGASSGFIGGVAVVALFSGVGTPVIIAAGIIWGIAGWFTTEAVIKGRYYVKIDWMDYSAESLKQFGCTSIQSIS